MNYTLLVCLLLSVMLTIYLIGILRKKPVEIAETPVAVPDANKNVVMYCPIDEKFLQFLNRISGPQYTIEMEARGTAWVSESNTTLVTNSNTIGIADLSADVVDALTDTGLDKDSEKEDGITSEATSLEYADTLDLVKELKRRSNSLLLAMEPLTALRYTKRKDLEIFTVGLDYALIGLSAFVYENMAAILKKKHKREKKDS